MSLSKLKSFLIPLGQEYSFDAETQTQTNLASGKAPA